MSTIHICCKELMKKLPLFAGIPVERPEHPWGSPADPRGIPRYPQGIFRDPRGSPSIRERYLGILRYPWIYTDLYVYTQISIYANIYIYTYI